MKRTEASPNHPTGASNPLSRESGPKIRQWFREKKVKMFHVTQVECFGTDPNGCGQVIYQFVTVNYLFGKEDSDPRGQFPWTCGIS